MISDRLNQQVINYRPMNKEDVDYVPISCQGTRANLLRRFDDIDSCAILGFNGDRHVAQFRFRRFEHNLVSPNGLWDPLYWWGFGDFTPALPENSLSVFYYHVGQIEDNEDRDHRYHGRRVGLALLDYLVDWAERNGFAALTAKFTPADRKYHIVYGRTAPRELSRARV